MIKQLESSQHTNTLLFYYLTKWFESSRTIKPNCTSEITDIMKKSKTKQYSILNTKSIGLIDDEESEKQR